MENEEQNIDPQGRDERSEEQKKRDKRLEEIKKLVDLSKRNTEGKQGNLFSNEDLGKEDVGFDASILSDTADPDKSHALYYSMRRMLMEKLPGGKENAKLRKLIYDEKNLFLNRGKAIDSRGRRGSDGRMSFISTFMEPAFNAVAEWVKKDGSPFEAYTAFYDLNEAYGFHKDENSDNSDNNGSPENDDEGGIPVEV